MSYAKRMSQLPTTRAQQLAALTLVAALAFALGLAAATVRRTAPITAAVSPPAHAAADVRRAPALVRVPYEAGWALYDGGWAGGPAAPRAVVSKPGAIERVPYEAGWELYDGGWAGGPASMTAPRAVVSKPAAVERVPYEAGWELYDGGWAGGPHSQQ